MSSDINTLANDIASIEAELGVAPSGIYSTIRTRLDILESRINNPLDPSPNAENPFFIGNDGVSLSAGIGEPTEDRVSGSLYLRQDGYHKELYSRQNNLWILISDAVGLQGPAGPKGDDGSQGSIGSQGATGPSGATGSQGADGAAGPTGPSGSTGSQGATGATGPIGPSGATGTTGATGPQGATGSTGSSGSPIIDVLISNDGPGDSSVVIGSGASSENTNTGECTVTFTVPFSDALYKPMVTAEDLASGGAGVCGAWIIGRTSTTITIGTWKSLAGSTFQADGVGFNLSIIL